MIFEQALSTCPGRVRHSLTQRCFGLGGGPTKHKNRGDRLFRGEWLNGTRFFLGGPRSF